MEKIVDVAQYVYKYYLKETDEKIDEMKLHKLLYFVQRESYALLGKPMFNQCLMRILKDGFMDQFQKK